MTLDHRGVRLLPRRGALLDLRTVVPPPGREKGRAPESESPGARPGPPAPGSRRHRPGGFRPRRKPLRSTAAGSFRAAALEPFRLRWRRRAGIGRASLVDPTPADAGGRYLTTAIRARDPRAALGPALETAAYYELDRRRAREIDRRRAREIAGEVAAAAGGRRQRGSGFRGGSGNAWLRRSSMGSVGRRPPSGRRRDGGGISAAGWMRVVAGSRPSGRGGDSPDVAVRSKPGYRPSGRPGDSGGAEWRGGGWGWRGGGRGWNRERPRRDGSRSVLWRAWARLPAHSRAGARGGVGAGGRRRVVAAGKGWKPMACNGYESTPGWNSGPP